MPIKKKIVVQEKMFKTISVQLEKALPSLKEQIGEKKFKKRLKKVSKILSAGIEKANRVSKTSLSKKASTVKKKLA